MAIGIFMVNWADGYYRNRQFIAFSMVGVTAWILLFFGFVLVV